MDKAAKAAFWFIICSFLQRGITVLTTPIFTRVLSTSDYGLFNVFSSWMEIFTVIFTLRICYGAYMRNLVKNPEDRDAYTSSMLGLTTTMIVFWFVIYCLFSKKINNILSLTTPMMICMFVLILTSTSYSFWSSHERVDFRYKKLVIVTLSVSILKPVFGILFVLLVSVNKTFYRILSLTIVELAFFGILFFYQLIKGKIFFNKQYWKEAILFNIPLVPHYLSQIILNHSDRLMINAFCGPSDTGIYSLAYSLAMLMVFFNNSINNTLTPWIYQQLKNKNYTQVKKICTLCCLFVNCINILIMFFAPEAMRLFAPSSYYEAIFVIPPVTSGVFFMFLYGIFVNSEIYYGNNKLVMIASTFGAVLNVVLNYIFIPKYGYQAAAYTTLVGYIVYAILHGIFAKMTFIKNNIHERVYDFKILAIISLCNLLIEFICMYAYKNCIFRFSVLILMSMFIIMKRDNIRKTLKDLIILKIK